MVKISLISENNRLTINISGISDYTEEMVSFFKRKHRAKVKEVLEGPDVRIYIIIIDNQKVNVVFNDMTGTSVRLEKENETLIKKLKESIEKRLKEIDENK